MLESEKYRTGQSANTCDLAPHDGHGRNIDTSGTSVEARTESPCVGTYELGVRTVAVTDLDEAEGAGEDALALALLVSFLPTSDGTAEAGNKCTVSGLP